MSSFGGLRIGKGRVRDGGAHCVFPLPFVPATLNMGPPYQMVLKRKSCSRRQYRKRYRFIQLILLFNITVWSLNQMGMKKMGTAIDTTSRLHDTSGFHSLVLYFNSRQNTSRFELCSTAQYRILSHLWERVSSFYSDSAVFPTMCGGCRTAIGDSTMVANYSNSSFVSSLFTLFYQQLHLSINIDNNQLQQQQAASMIIDDDHPTFNKDSPLTISDGVFGYNAKHNMVPLVASRLSLPETALHQVDMLAMLPENARQVYSDPTKLLLSADQLALRELQSFPCNTRPYVNGTREEYIRMVRRLLDLDMMDITSTPSAVNGVFAVSKDTDSDRLIIDAQNGNKRFVDPPDIHLPNPSHLCSLQVPKGYQLVVGKTDLSNYYHHIRIPHWISQYLCLPAVTYAELGITPPTGISEHETVYPMCTTLPMGWSHSVYVAQVIHEHRLYSRGVLSKQDNVLNLSSPLMAPLKCVHSIYIDDLALISVVPVGSDDHSISNSSITLLFDRVLHCYDQASLVVKHSKVVRPTTLPVTVLGVELSGHIIDINHGKLSVLIQQTLRALAFPTVSGYTLSQLIGSWCWIMLLNRSSLSSLRHVWRYIRIAGHKQFTLWKCIRKELMVLLGLVPLLYVDLQMDWHSKMLATDASNLGAGVVTSDATDTILSRVWPLHYGQQQYINAEAGTGWCNPMYKRTSMYQNRFRCQYHLTQPAFHRLPVLSNPKSFEKLLRQQSWSIVISHRWKHPVSTSTAGHINHLEGTSLLLALRWLASRRDGMHHRVMTFMDSSVLFYSVLKGRSSSSLYPKIRSIAAHLLALHVQLFPVWLPSQWNPADEPSRNFQFLLSTHARRLRCTADYSYSP